MASVDKQIVSPVFYPICLMTERSLLRAYATLAVVRQIESTRSATMVGASLKSILWVINTDKNGRLEKMKSDMFL